MKEFINNYKKELIFGLIGMLLMVSVVIIFFSSSKSANKLKEPIVHEQSYVMYLKINPLVKLDFKEKYKECFNESGEKYVCEQKKNVVTNYKLLNSDAKTMFYNLDINEKELNDVIVMLCDVAKENGVEFDSFELTSNYNFNKNDLENYIKNKSNNNLTLNINYNFKEIIDENEVIDNEEEKEKIYVVTFDSNGGNKVDNQLIKENEKATKPTSPTKNGYTFINWMLDGKEYDFNTPVTSDITIKAEWKNNNSNSNNNNNKTTNNTNSNNNNNNKTTNNTNSSNNNNNNSNNNNNQNSSDNMGQEPPYPEPCNIYFDTVYPVDEKIPNQSNWCDDKVEKPNDPTALGKVFVEWQLDGKKYDFNTIVTKDIVLQAVWKDKTLPKLTNVQIINLGLKSGYIDLNNLSTRVIYDKIDDTNEVEIRCAHNINGPYSSCEYFEEGEKNNYGNNRIKFFDDGTYVKLRYVDNTISPAIYGEYSDPIYIPAIRKVSATKSDTDLIISNAEGVNYIVCKQENNGVCNIMARLSGNGKLPNYLYYPGTKLYVFSYYEGNGYKLLFRGQSVS